MIIRKLASFATLAFLSAAAVLAQTGSVLGQTGNTQNQTGTASALNQAFGTGFDFSSGFGASAFGGAGATTATGAAGFGGATGGRGAFGGGFGGGFGGRGGVGQTQNNQQNNNKIRATVKLGFTYVGLPPQVRTQKVNATLARLPLPSRLSGVRVNMNGRTALLTGTVESEDDVTLLEQLVSLEPGVDEVDTARLVVRGSSSRSVPAPLGF